MSERGGWAFIIISFWCEDCFWYQRRNNDNNDNNVNDHDNNHDDNNNVKMMTIIMMMIHSWILLIKYEKSHENLMWFDP